MISKKNKIQKHYFPKVLKGKRFFGEYGDFIISPSLSEKVVHSGIIISKKYAKKAVTRNFIKRIYYRVFAQFLLQLPIKTIVFMYKKSFTQFNEQKFTQELTRLLTEITLFYEKDN
jgi:ribonuclease P protein component